MKVILIENIKGLGRIGDIKNVSDGYARNMLFPKKLAKVATDGSIKEADSLQKKREIAGATEERAAQKAMSVLTGMTIEFKKKASKTGTLFSSVTKTEIAKELSKKARMNIDSDTIDLGKAGEHIKHTGQHSITVRLSQGMDARVTVAVHGN